jgi:hypothetical protein
MGVTITPENVQLHDPAAPGTNQIRAATWNVHVLTANTRNNPVAVQFPNEGAETNVRKEDTILKTLRHFRVDVAALQEVYVATPGAALPVQPGEGYSVLPGGHIKVNATAIPYEHCPIVFDANKLDCTTPERSSVPSHTHWATCTIKNTTKKFSFGCGHFEYRTGRLEANIDAMFDEFATADPKIGATAASQANFILGLDANSNPRGHNASLWTDRLATWNADNPAHPNAVVWPAVGPANTATKVYKASNGDIQITRTPGKQVIDFLIHSLQDIAYAQGSMQVLDVRQMNTARVGQPFWREFYKVSDHLPVKADYTY